ncbi:MAG: hydroxymethylglutaryl-CoA lyase [Clostridia bacterium]|nr:hydroxymethylglutaryl-CoA lyase [Clostridia bacterium]
MFDFPREITVVEVGPRDGFQNVKEFIPTDKKIGLINALARTGIARIEATSFVHPKAVPQMADAGEVFRQIEKVGGVRYSALVPNLRGAEKALEAGVRELVFVVSASETHNRKNVNRSIEESLDEFEAIAGAASRVPGCLLRLDISTAFGCPFEGKVPVEAVARIAARARDLGTAEVNLCDTTGMANPRQVYEEFTSLKEMVPDVNWAAHFHNTRGAGLANVLAALQAGITVFDASIGGLGGCPFAPGATGNIATEDLVHMLEEMGLSTGIDLPALINCARLAEEYLGFTLPGQVMKAGRACDLHPV